MPTAKEGVRSAYKQDRTNNLGKDQRLRGNDGLSKSLDIVAYSPFFYLPVLFLNLHQGRAVDDEAVLPSTVRIDVQVCP